MKVRFERWLGQLLRLRRVRLPIPGPAMMDLPVGELVTTAIAKFGCYEKETVNRVLELVKTSQYFLDVGGHFGQYTVAVAAALGPGGRVVTVEPNPQNYLELIRNIQLNGSTNVYAVLAAASGTEGLLALDSGAGGNSGSSCTSEGVVGGGTIVPAFRLADLLRRLGIPRVDVVKLDIEGFEPEALDGLLMESLSLPRHIIFEYLPQFFPTGHEVVERLRKKGYTLWQVTGATFDPSRAPVNDNVWATLDLEMACSSSGSREMMCRVD